MRILLVEDNIDLAESIADFLNMQNHICDFAFDGKAGLQKALDYSYDLYILDIAMPKMDGLTLCETLRNNYNEITPVLFLTARHTLEDKLAGFSVGADDYLVKPFELKELNVRIRAIHNRHIGTSRKLQIHDLRVDLVSEEVSRANDRIILSPNTFKLLVALIQRSPAIVSREELEYLVWGDELPDSDSLRSHIYKLRNQIDKPYKRTLIETIRRRGFRIR